MASVKQPSKVSSITISGNVLTVSAGRVLPPNDTLSTVLTHHTTRPQFVKANLTNGDITIRFPLQVTSITINSVVYTPDASGFIVIPAADGTAFLEELKYAL
jgi:hypothetical protein